MNCETCLKKETSETAARRDEKVEGKKGGKRAKKGEPFQILQYFHSKPSVAHRLVSRSDSFRRLKDYLDDIGLQLVSVLKQIFGTRQDLNNKPFVVHWLAWPGSVRLFSVR